MLLEQALAEFSEIGNEGNEEPKWENVERPHIETEKPHPEVPNSTPEKEIGRVECNGNAYLMSPELKLHLGSEREFFHRLLIRKELANRNSEDSLVCCRAPVSVPFKWEEEPGKPKNLSVEETPLVLSLPPVRQSSLNSRVGDARLIANCPRTVSGRLRNILLTKFHAGKPFDPPLERMGEKQVVANELLQYPEEFGCSLQKDSSPVSIFECPDSPSSSSSGLLSYCSRPSSSTRQDSAPALLANRLVPMKEMLSAVPVESSGPICPKLPAPFVSVDGDKNLGPKMIGSSCEEAMGSSRIHGEFMGLQSVKYGSSPDALIGESKRSAKSSSRSVSWGGTEIIDAKVLREPFNGLIPVEEEEVKGKACYRIKDRELHRASSSMPSTSIPVQQTCGSSTSLCFGTSSSMKMAYFGLQPGSDKRHDSFQGTARSNKHSNKVQKHFKDGLRDGSNMEVKGQKKTIGSCRRRTQMVAARSKRWTFAMPLGMNITNCCSPVATNTINCCSSRRATHAIGRRQDREKSISLSNYQKLQLEWNKLYEEDYIQRISLF